MDEEEAIREWDHASHMYMEIIRYCDGYPDMYRTREHVKKMRERWGKPSTHLRTWAKRQLINEYVKYWRTI